MKPAKRPNSSALPALQLYRDEIEELVNLFRSRCQQVTIMDERHTFDSVGELVQNRSKIGLLHISGFVPHVEVWVRGKRDPNFQRSAIVTPDTNDPANHLFLAAKDFLLDRRWKSRIRWLKFGCGAGAVLLLAGIFLKDQFPGNSFWAKTLWNLGVIAVMTFTGFCFASYGQHVSSINAAYRSQLPSFWEKNKNELFKYILFTIIGSILGALLTVIGLWVKHRFFPTLQ